MDYIDPPGLGLTGRNDLGGRQSDAAVVFGTRGGVLIHADVPGWLSGVVLFDTSY